MQTLVNSFEFFIFKKINNNNIRFIFEMEVVFSFHQKKFFDNVKRNSCDWVMGLKFEWSDPDTPKN